MVQLFRWIKQDLRIKAFYGTSENAVKTQIWVALSVYVLVAIVRKRLALNVSLYQLLQILSVTLFEKTPISIAVFAIGSQFDVSTTATNCNCSTYDRTLLVVHTFVVDEQQAWLASVLKGKAHGTKITRPRVTGRLRSCQRKRSRMAKPANPRKITKVA